MGPEKLQVVQEERLQYILGFVDNHVRFAETKNAALFAANAALVVAIVQLMKQVRPTHVIAEAYFWMFVALMLASAVLTLLSFLPRTHIPWMRTHTDARASDNVLFFGDLQKYGTDDYLKALAAAGGDAFLNPTQLERAYADQILVNARIASRKFTYFKYAAWCTLSAGVTPVGAGLIWMFIHDDTKAVC